MSKILAPPSTLTVLPIKYRAKATGTKSPIVVWRCCSNKTETERTNERTNERSLFFLFFFIRRVIWCWQVFRGAIVFFLVSVALYMAVNAGAWPPIENDTESARARWRQWRQQECGTPLSTSLSSFSLSLSLVFQPELSRSLSPFSFFQSL